MTYEIGQKVETPLGVGLVTYYNGDTVWVSINKTPEISFNVDLIKPYKTAHEKLLEMGWERITSEAYLVVYTKDELAIIIDPIQKCYRIYEQSLTLIELHVWVDLELSRILTQYLEEMEE